MAKTISAPDQAGLRRLWTYARPHRPKIILATVFSSLGKVMDVAPEILIGGVIDVIVRGKGSFLATAFGIEDQWQQLIVLTVLNAIIWILESVFGYLASITWRGLAQTIEHELRLGLYSHIQGLEVAWFEDTSSGGLLSVINDDINQLERFLDGGAHAIIVTFWNVVLVGAVFFASSATLAVLAFLPIPVIVVGSFWYQKKLTPLYAGVREAVSELSSTLTTNLGGITTIKAFTAEAREVDRVGGASAIYMEANKRAILFSSAFPNLIRMVVLSGFTCTLVYGGWLTLNKQMEVSIFSVLVFMTQRLLWPMTALGETFDLYQRALASINRIFGLMDVKPTMKEGTSDLVIPTKGEISFEGVKFGYATNNLILKGIDIKIPSGETHAIVGATGAGKSTIIRLLMRFYDCTEGRVLIDGMDVRQASYSALRGCMGYVSQDVFLFHGTVRENIAYGRLSASDEEIEEAAMAAEAHDFIVAMANGYDTVVGERGQKLSGGQRQRISLARAILRDPAILVLDEATSSVDNETEAAIQRSLLVVTKNRTSIVIAHRLSTVRDADRIWVLEAGEVVESGTHEELTRSGGLYAALWRVQTGEKSEIATSTRP